MDLPKDCFGHTIEPGRQITYHSERYGMRMAKVLTIKAKVDRHAKLVWTVTAFVQQNTGRNYDSAVVSLTKLKNCVVFNA